MDKQASEEAKYDPALELGNFGNARKKVHNVKKRGKDTGREHIILMPQKIH